MTATVWLPQTTARIVPQPTARIAPQPTARIVPQLTARIVPQPTARIVLPLPLSQPLLRPHSHRTPTTGLLEVVHRQLSSFFFG